MSRAYVCIQASYYYRKIYGSYTQSAFGYLRVYLRIIGAIYRVFSVLLCILTSVPDLASLFE